MKYAIGADIGGTTVKLGLFTAEGDLLEKWEIPTDTREKGAHVLADIAKSIEGKLAEKAIDHQDVLGVGFGVPGAVLEDGTVNRCVNLGWEVVHIRQDFEALTGLRAWAGNDGDVAALGEVWKGGGREYRNAVMVTLGTGVGGGVILDGQIIHGSFGAAGEIGHIPMIEGEEERCGCGKKGCLEQYSSANGLARVARRLLLKSSKESMLRGVDPLTAKDVCDCAHKGDPLAKEAITWSMSLLGKAMATISAVVDPEVFIIGGGLSRSGDLLLDPIRKAYVQYSFHASRDTVIRLAELGNDAGICGAVKLVLNAQG